jgi:hypothetical protein
VWWRRVNYFVSLGFVLVAAAFPLLANYLRTGGVTESLDVTAGGSVGWAIESKMQTTRWAKCAYKFAAQEALPFGFLVLAAFAVLSLGIARPSGRSLLQIEYK